MKIGCICIRKKRTAVAEPFAALAENGALVTGLFRFMLLMGFGG